MSTNYYQPQLQLQLNIPWTYLLPLDWIRLIRLLPSVGTIFPSEDFLPSPGEVEEPGGRGRVRGWAGLNYTDREQILIPVK